ncbi:MAG: YjbQ family protein [Deltaproteobacteria bacterium]|nr:YjbQ family protein [Deltaproteobacteria bacterium]
MISMCREFKVDSAGYTDLHDLTDQVQHIVSDSGLAEGIATVFCPGATASVTTIEFESGAVADLKAAIRRAAPEEIPYKHDARWGDGNGFSHVRAALGGPSLTVPVSGGLLVLGTWQQIVLLDHDNGSRRRKVVIQLLGTD